MSSKQRRGRQVKFRVTGFGADEVFTARTAGHAVSQFKKAFCLAVASHKDGSGWAGISVEVKPSE